jgi:hypothetical protein
LYSLAKSDTAMNTASFLVDALVEQKFILESVIEINLAEYCEDSIGYVLR